MSFEEESVGTAAWSSLEQLQEEVLHLPPGRWREEATWQPWPPSAWGVCVRGGGQGRKKHCSGRIPTHLCHLWSDLGSCLSDLLSSPADGDDTCPANSKNQRGKEGRHFLDQTACKDVEVGTSVIHCPSNGRGTPTSRASRPGLRSLGVRSGNGVEET